MLSSSSNPLAGKQENDWIGPAPQVTDSLPGPKAEQLVRRDVAITSPSNTREYPLVVKRAHGSVVEDIDGNRFLDFAAGIAVCATGHCHPKVVEAIQKQAADLIHICWQAHHFPVRPMPL